MADFLITLFLGIFGVHRFMRKKYVTGLIWLCTLGLGGVGWFVDVCIAFSNMAKGGEKEGDKAEEVGQANLTGAGHAVQKGQQTAGQGNLAGTGHAVQKGQQAVGQRIQAGQPQSSGQTGDGEKKGFWAEMKEKAIKNRQEAAIRAAYKKEEEKRKPKIKKIRHTRPLTPQEQQSIDMIEMEITKMENDYKNKRITDRSGINRLWGQRNDIKRRAEWYETIELPPEIDPDTPIYVDEEAIRNSITGLF